MHSQSLRNSYSESGVLVYSPQQNASQGGAGSTGPGRHNPSTTRIARHNQGGKVRIAVMLGLLLLTAAGGGYGYKYVKGVQAEAKQTQSELKAALAQVQVAEKKVGVAEEKALLSEDQVAESKASLAQLTKTAAQKEQATKQLQEELQSLLKEGQGQVTLGKDGRLTLQLVDKVLFRSGEAELTKRGERVMSRVGLALKEMKDKQVWVQGHTDAVPVRKDNEKFSSNWELSAARALTVVHYLQDQSGVNPKRLAAAAFGSHRPVSRRKKSKNRRIEIVLFPLDVKLRR
jgi:chemotaxis protein MotB